MKKSRFFCLFASIILLLSLTGCNNVEKYPSNYEQLSVLLGQPLETVCSKLELSAEELSAVSQSVYQLPEKSTYADVPFDVFFIINLHENTLHGIRYTAVYEGDAESKVQAAQDIVAVADTLSKAMGDTYVKKETVISELSESALTEIFSQPEAFHENNYWNLTQNAPAEVTSYIEHLETTEYWKEYTNLENMTASYYLDFDVVYNPTFEQLGITLEYKIDPSRGDGNYEEVEGGIISQN